MSIDFNDIGDKFAKCLGAILQKKKRLKLVAVI